LECHERFVSVLVDGALLTAFAVALLIGRIRRRADHTVR
jgi:hypothetical protein